MSFGLNAIVNTQNSIMIDRTYKNLSLVQSGSLNCNTKAGPYDSVYSAQFIVNGPTNPIVAIRCEVGYAYILLMNIDSGNYYYTVFLDLQNTDDVNTRGPVYYYVFDNVPDSYSGSATMGLRILDDNQKTTYDSRFRYMRVVDSFDTTGNLTRNYDASRTYAATMSTPQVQALVTVSGNQQLLSLGGYGFKIKNGIVDFSKITRFKTFAPGQKLYTYNSRGQYLLLDVTNM